MALIVGLAVVLVGATAFAGTGLARTISVVGGTTLVLASAFGRLVVWRSAVGKRSQTVGSAKVMALAHAACAASLLGLLAGTEDGAALVGLDFADARSAARGRYAILALSAMTMAAGLLPALAARWALARTHVQGVVQASACALSAALAGCTLVLLGWVASSRDVVADFSYFKTSSPGSAVESLTRSLGEPLRALLFFPEVDPVKDEVSRYFRELERAAGGVEVSAVDRFADPGTAERYRIARDATVILAVGDSARERIERIGLPSDLDEARGNLRVFDGFVHEALSKLARARRVAYFTAGHGELSDGTDRGVGLSPGDAALPSSSEGAPPLGRLRELLATLNYEVRDIGIRQGLAAGVPDDAAMLLVIGPRTRFLDSEVASVREYLERGGSALFAAEPDSGFDLEPFADLLDLRLGDRSVADEQVHGRRRGGRADRGLVVTDRFSGHPAVATVARAGPGAGALFDGSGEIRLSSGQGERGEAEDARRRTRVSSLVSALPSSFVDLDRDLSFDPDTESKGGITLVAAAEGGAEGFRAIVYADADPFADAVLAALAVNATMVADNLRWLGREEELAGEIESEEDLPVLHTRPENVVWFQAVILGVPVLVLAGGLTYLFGRGRARHA